MKILLGACHGGKRGLSTVTDATKGFQNGKKLLGVIICTLPYLDHSRILERRQGVNLHRVIQNSLKAGFDAVSALLLFLPVVHSHDLGLHKKEVCLKINLSLVR